MLLAAGKMLQCFHVASRYPFLTFRNQNAGTIQQNRQSLIDAKYRTFLIKVFPGPH